MTEASPVTHFDSCPPKIGTVGPTLPNTLAKVGLVAHQILM